MTEPPNLFDTLAPSHAGDPTESRMAAAKVKAQHQLEQVLLCLLAAEKPLTDDELGDRLGLLRHAAGTRRGIAVKRGWIVRAGTGETPRGNPCATWVLTAAGVSEALRLRRSAA